MRVVAQAGSGNGGIGRRRHRADPSGALPCFIEHQVDFGQGEAGDLHAEVEVDQGLKFDGEQLLVPACIQRQLVVGEHIGPAGHGTQVRSCHASARSFQGACICLTEERARIPAPAVLTRGSEGDDVTPRPSGNENWRLSWG